MADTSKHHLASLLCNAVQEGKPANIALMQLLIAAKEGPKVDSAIAAALAHYASSASTELADRLREVSQLWRANPDAWRVVRSIVENIPHHGSSAPQTISDWAAAFDRAAATEPDAGVALYSFGNTALLEAATADLVDWLLGLGLLTAHARVLDIGCGSGRLLRALAGHVALIVGIDISTEMIRVAQDRCGGLANVLLEHASGQDLRGWSDHSFDVVLAVDVLPYVVPVGCEVVRAYLAEIARVLRDGGTLVLLNFSYRGEREQDRRDVAAIAAEVGLETRENGISPFKLWDGIAFLLVKPAAGTPLGSDR